ncbi:hypothetical protein ACE0DR_25805 [Azotobacter sp. CWF10]
MPVHAADLTGPLQVSDGNSLQLGTDDVLTHGAGSFALAVTGAGSSALIDGSRINVTGNGSAVSAANGGRVQLRGCHPVDRTRHRRGLLRAVCHRSRQCYRCARCRHRCHAQWQRIWQRAGLQRWRDPLHRGCLSATGTGAVLAGASGKGSELHLADLQMSADGGARLRADSAGLLTIRNSRITLAPGGIPAGVAVNGVGSRAELYDTYLQNGWFDIDSGGSVLLENVEAHSVGGSMRLLGSSISKTYSSAVINGGSFSTVGGYGVNINSWGQLDRARRRVRCA